MAVAPQQHAEIVEPGDEPLQLHAVDQKDGDRSFRFADMIQKRVLEVLRLLGCHEFFPYFGPLPAVVIEILMRAFCDTPAARLIPHCFGARRQINRNTNVKAVFSDRSAMLAERPSKRGNDRSRPSVADRLAVDRHDGHGDRGGAGEEGLARALRLVRRERSFLEAKAELAPATSISAARVTPCRIASSACRVTSAPSAVTIQALVDAPSVTNPARSTNQASNAPASRAACLASTFGSKLQRLDVRARPSLVRQRDHRDAGRGSRRADGRVERSRATTTRPGFVAVGRKAVIAPRRAAADLQIDEAVAHAVPPHDLAHDEPQRRLADRPGDPHRGKRAREAGEMARLLDQRAAADLADLVDAVAEGEGAIVDRHRRLREPERSGR